MSIKEWIDKDLKTAMLAGNKDIVSTLRGIKSAILYVEVAKGLRETGGLSDSEIIDVLSKESKKRQESADLYRQGGDQERQAAELAEKVIIDGYLPAQLSETELTDVIDTAITELSAAGPSAMGQVIGRVKEKTAGRADGAAIARLVKERLTANL